MIKQECENCLFSLCVDSNIMEFFMVQVICNIIERRAYRQKVVDCC